MFVADITSQERRIGIAVHTADIGGHVNVDDVTLGDHRRVRNTVTDDLVQRCTAGFRKSPVAQCRRVGAVINHVVVGDAVEFIRAHPGHHGLAGLGQRAGRDAPGHPHLLDYLGGLHPWFVALGGGGSADVFGALDRLRHRQSR